MKRPQYAAHCMPCHGTLDGASPVVGLGELAKIPFVPLDYVTDASKAPIADASLAVVRPATFLGTVRPLFDQKCGSCHAGASPAGELSLEKAYSPNGNYPAGIRARC